LSDPFESGGQDGVNSALLGAALELREPLSVLLEFLELVQRKAELFAQLPAQLNRNCDVFGCDGLS
jgi:hypothetical protein